MNIVIPFLGEKPYKCLYPGCRAAFSQKSPLKLHTKKIHKLDNINKIATNDSSVLNSNASIAAQSTPFSTSTSFSGFTFTVHCQPSPPSDQAFHSQLFNANLSSHSQYVHKSGCFESNESFKSQDNSILVTCHVSPSTVHGVTHPFNSSIKLNANQTSDSFSSQVQSTSTHSGHSHQQHHLPVSENALNSCNFVSDMVKNIMHIQDENDLNISDQTLSTIENIISSSNQTDHDQIVSNIPNDSSDILLFSNCSNVVNNHETSMLNSPHTFSNDPKELQVNVKNLDSTFDKPFSDSDLFCPDLSKSSTELAMILKPVRKRANYRLKVRPETNNEKNGLTLRKRPASKKLNSNKCATKETNANKRITNKRTIAVQTTKKTLTKKIKGEPFVCDICKREFKAKHDRDCHRMTHTGETN